MILINNNRSIPHVHTCELGRVDMTMTKPEIEIARKNKYRS